MSYSKKDSVVNKFAVNVVNVCSRYTYVQCTPMEITLDENRDPSDLYLVMFIPDVSNEHIPVCMAIVPTLEFENSNVSEMFRDARMHMRTLVVSTFGNP